MLTLIYDFETSGLNIYHDDVIEIGCRCLELDDYFTILIYPLSDKLLSDKNQKITGITNEFLKKNGVKPLNGYIQFFDYLLEKYTIDNHIVMIAHNGMAFDDIFLKRIHRYLQGEEHSEYDNMMKDIIFIDSLNISRLLYNDRQSYSLESMCKMFNILNKSPHRAMGDVDALSELWNHLVNKIKNKNADISGSNLKYITYV